MNFIDSLLLVWEKHTKASVGDFCFIEANTPDKKHFIAKDGGLISFFKINGLNQLLPDSSVDEHFKALEKATRKLFSINGCRLTFVYEKDKSLSAQIVDPLYDRFNKNILSLGYESTAYNEAARNYFKDLLIPDCTYLVIHTTPAVLSQRMLKNVVEEKSSKITSIKSLSGAANCDIAINEIRKTHAGFSTQVHKALSRFVSLQHVDCYESLSAVKSMVTRAQTKGWKPRLVGDKCDMRGVSSGVDDMNVSPFFTPSISEQLFTGSIVKNKINPLFIQGDNIIFAPFHLDLAPQDPSRFSNLLEIIGSDTPFRAVFDLELGIASAKKKLANKKNAAGFARIGNDEAANTYKACSRMIDDINNGKTPIVMRVNFCTWGKNIDEVSDRHEKLMRAVESWGNAGVKCEKGDVNRSFLSTLPGFRDDSIANPIVTSLVTALKMLPIDTDGSPFKRASALFNKPDYTPFNIELGSSQQDYWSMLILAEMGSGKTVLATRLFDTVIKNSSGSFPSIGAIDIGNTMSFWAESQRAMLPADKQHNIQAIKVINSKQQQINPFDLPLVLRRPLSMQRSELVDFISLFLTSAGADPSSSEATAITEFVPALIDEMYNAAIKSPKPYSPTIPEVINALADNNISPAGMSWYGVADKLFESGNINECILAHRMAVPTVGEIPSVLQQSTNLTKIYCNQTIGSSTFFEFINRSVSSGISAYKNLSGATNVNIAQAKIKIIDLLAVALPPTSPINCKQTAIYYMLSNSILNSNVFMNKEVIETIENETYREFHMNLLKSKGMSIYLAEEWHRPAALPQPVATFERYQREGRKFDFFPIAISQDIQSFTATQIKLSSFIVMMSLPRIEDAEEFDALSKKAGVPPAILEEAANSGFKTGPRGAPALIKTKTKGRLSFNIVYSSQPGCEILMSATTAEDGFLRSYVDEYLGRTKGLLAISKCFGTSCKDAFIETRNILQSDDKPSSNDDVCAALWRQIKAST